MKTSSRKLLGGCIVLMSIVFILNVYFYAKTIFLASDKEKAFIYKDFAKMHADIKDGVIVLCYHRILNTNKGVKMAQSISSNAQLKEFNVNLNEFETQMSWLKEQGISVWSMDEFTKHAKNQTIKGKHVVLTFDDIDKTVPQNAIPLMQSFDLPYTCFIITGEVNNYFEGERLASWKEIQEIANDTYATLGLHTDLLHYQENGTPVLGTSLLTDEDLATDYFNSVNKLSKVTKREPKYFAYPYGRVNQQLSQFMLANGIEGIFTLDTGIATNQEDILTRVPRFLVTNDNFEQVQKWLTE